MSDGEPNPEASRFVKTELRALEGEELKPTEELKEDRFNKIAARIREIIGPRPTKLMYMPNSSVPIGNEPAEDVYVKGKSGKVYNIYKSVFTKNPADYTTIYLDTALGKQTWTLIEYEKSNDSLSKPMNNLEYENEPKLNNSANRREYGKYVTKENLKFEKPDQTRWWPPLVLSSPPGEKVAFERFDELLDDLSSFEVIDRETYDQLNRQNIENEAKTTPPEEYPEVENPEESFEQTLVGFLTLAGALHEDADGNSGTFNFRSKSGEEYYFSYDVGPRMRFYLTLEHPAVKETWSLEISKDQKTKHLSYKRESKPGHFDNHLAVEGKYDTGGKTAYGKEWPPSTPEEERIAFKKTNEVLEKLTDKIEVVDYMNRVTKTVEVSPTPEVVIGGPPPVPVGAR